MLEKQEGIQKTLDKIAANLAIAISNVNALKAENARLKEQLAMVQANAEDVWFWQGKGDRLEELVCPVVMSAQPLMKIMEGK